CLWPSANSTLLGTDAKKVWAFWQDDLTLDGPNAAKGTVRGTVSSAGLTSLTDSTASFPTSGVVLAPLCIVSGMGKGQTRIISSVSGTTLYITQPWLITPDTTSVYQIGGVEWSYQTKWFRFVDDEETNKRRVEAIYDPLTEACTADLQLYADFSGTPLNAGTTVQSSDNAGVGFTEGEPFMVIDFTKSIGFAQQRFDGHKERDGDGWRFVSLGLSGVSNADPVKLYGLTVDGVK